jgi:hypothetical protein
MEGISAMTYHNPYPPCNYSPPQPQHRKTLAWHVALYVGSALIAAALIGIFPGSADASPDPIIGDWNVTYPGGPTTVTMTLAGGVYTETAKTPVPITWCALPPGTVLSTFTQTGPGTYAGQHGIWGVANCWFQHWAGMTLNLNSDGNTLTLFGGPYGTFTFTKIL